MEVEKLKELALLYRKQILNLAYKSDGPSHLGGGLSMVEIFTVLYGNILRYDPKNPDWEHRDRFILSKGHGVLPFFVALHNAGFISQEELYTYKKNESDLISHPVMNLRLGMESSNGSLGHGLSMAVGMSIALKGKQNLTSRVFVVLGDGECNEGSVWEACMSAAHFKLDNLVAIVDYNKLQSDGQSEIVMDIGALEKKWESFGWEVISLDGHDIIALKDALKNLQTCSSPKPRVLIAHTIKGKGVSFMENNNTWHHNRLTQTTFEQAMEELNTSIV
jgi:transketolase